MKVSRDHLGDNRVGIGRSRAIVLPWPDKALSPNWRGHWASKSIAVRNARGYANGMARAAKWREIPLPDRKVRLVFEFHPPDRRKRDDDNLKASIKHARDGIADALGIDDHQFLSDAVFATEPFPQGAVVVWME